MASNPPVVIYPPGEDGGRRVRVGAEFVGMAYTILDVVEFLRGAGLEDVEPEDVADEDWVEWRAVGPGAWL
ncbi:MULTISPECIES: hypothetical protein [Streptomyces]|uniref:Uncharacterized protein n=1 Tax=Streptomyces dengpaensis TaxID=2049881 RepID=A0ABM6SZ49_9ACTN|nr:MULTISPECIES: hypothetical protein [Streptomyces]AVH60034.1 hypothetical protein C4B68_34350 [Streptomyces dengpaensis]PIB09673.1 hypothetical protein B1C81_11030 [Streptomyces sp. HG99]